MFRLLTVLFIGWMVAKRLTPSQEENKTEKKGNGTMIKTKEKADDFKNKINDLKKNELKELLAAFKEELIEAANNNDLVEMQDLSKKVEKTETVLRQKTNEFKKKLNEENINSKTHSAGKKIGGVVNGFIQGFKQGLRG